MKQWEFTAQVWVGQPRRQCCHSSPPALHLHTSPLKMMPWTSAESVGKELASGSWGVTHVWHEHTLEVIQHCSCTGQCIRTSIWDCFQYPCPLCLTFLRITKCFCVTLTAQYTLPWSLQSPATEPEVLWVSACTGTSWAKSSPSPRGAEGGIRVALRQPNCTCIQLSICCRAWEMCKHVTAVIFSSKNNRANRNWQKGTGFYGTAEFLPDRTSQNIL